MGEKNHSHTAFRNDLLPSSNDIWRQGGGLAPPIPGLAQFIETPTPIVPLATPELPTRVAVAPSQPVARAVMFGMKGCPHHEEVIQRVLPSLQQKYGEQLDIRLIKVITTQDVEQMYQIAVNYNIPKEETGVPLLIIGNQALVGSNQIETELPTVIEKILGCRRRRFTNHRRTGCRTHSSFCFAGHDATRATRATGIALRTQPERATVHHLLAQQQTIKAFLG